MAGWPGSGRVIGGLALLALPLLGGCGRDDPPASPPTPVRILVLAPQTPASGVRYSASVTPYTQVPIDFDVEGSVVEIQQVPGADGRMRDLQPGDPVEKDAVLARVDDAQYVDRLEEARARRAEAEAALGKARAEFERDSKLFSTQSITAPEYDRARKDFESSQAEVAGAGARVDQERLRLEACTLRSPMSGVLLAREIETGQLIRSGTRAFLIGDLRSVKLAFGVPDVALQNVDLGSTLRFTTPSLRNRVFQGRVTSVAPAADAATRVFEVELTVPNPDGALRPGMIAGLELGGEAARAQVLAVPVGAVLRSAEDPQGYAVPVVDGEGEQAVARLRSVELGDPVGDTVVVTRGLQAGERVIVSGATQVRDGAPVRIIP